MDALYSTTPNEILRSTPYACKHVTDKTSTDEYDKFGEQKDLSVLDELSFTRHPQTNDVRLE